MSEWLVNKAPCIALFIGNRPISGGYKVAIESVRGRDEGLALGKSMNEQNKGRFKRPDRMPLEEAFYHGCKLSNDNPQCHLQ